MPSQRNVKRQTVESLRARANKPPAWSRCYLAGSAFRLNNIPLKRVKSLRRVCSLSYDILRGMALEENVSRADFVALLPQKANRCLEISSTSAQHASAQISQQLLLTAMQSSVLLANSLQKLASTRMFGSLLSPFTQSLTTLIEGMSGPEFAYRSVGDFETSLSQFVSHFSDVAPAFFQVKAARQMKHCLSVFLNVTATVEDQFGIPAGYWLSNSSESMELLNSVSGKAIFEIHGGTGTLLVGDGYAVGEIWDLNSLIFANKINSC